MGLSFRTFSTSKKSANKNCYREWEKAVDCHVTEWFIFIRMGCTKTWQVGVIHKTSLVWHILIYLSECQSVFSSLFLFDDFFCWQWQDWTSITGSYQLMLKDIILWIWHSVYSCLISIQHAHKPFWSSHKKFSTIIWFFETQNRNRL